MGKKRITQLLAQLHENQQKELENAAAIFTVAQVAVNQLREQVSQPETALPPAVGLSSPRQVTQEELVKRYGSHLECRKAAKARGVVFRRTPTWKQLIAAFSYLEAFQQAIERYMTAYPNSDLPEMTIQLKLAPGGRVQRTDPLSSQ
ncbi:MAG: hypothetical protein LRZ84_13185 [Desertifilum sp.]|nr:hypothetical protein [Desertifilum sp.]